MSSPTKVLIKSEECKAAPEPRISISEKEPETTEWNTPPQFAGYKIEKELGRGGMGVVFQAEDLKLKRKVAIKAMLPSIAANPISKKRFLREAQTAAAIESDNIVSIFHVGESDDVPFIVMPLLLGKSLKEELASEGQLSLRRILKIAIEIATGLGSAHHAGLIHRDIKPANIWLEGEGSRAVILDFGLARASSIDAESITQSGVVLGTPGYMAPEQALAQAVDHRCDLFSLGCIVYQMCTGEQPFKITGNGEGIMSVVNNTPSPPIALRPDLPPALSALTMLLLSKDPEDRPASATIVVEMLRAIEKSKRNLAREPGKSKKVLVGQTRKVENRRQSFPDPPSGSGITMVKKKMGISIVLSPPKQRWFEVVRNSWTLLSGLALIGYSVYLRIQLGRFDPMIGLTTISSLACIGFYIRQMMPAKPETLKLGRNYIQHNLGRCDGSVGAIYDLQKYNNLPGRSYLDQLFGRPPFLKIRKTDFRGFRFDNTNGRQWIGYDYGIHTIEVGRFFGNPEREWLAIVIKAWSKTL